MPTHIQFTLTFDDYLKAHRLHAKRNLWSRFIDLVNRRLSVALGILILAFAGMISGPGVSWTYPFTTMIVCAIALILAPLYVRLRLKGCYRRTLIGDGARVIDFDEQSIKAEEAHIRSEFAWSAIRFTRENKSLLMLYLAPAKFIAIPKRVCSPEQIEELRLLFREKVSTR